MLLLLDNFEQSVEAAPGLARRAGACPNVKLLVTSREPLRIAAEQRVSGLTVRARGGASGSFSPGRAPPARRSRRTSPSGRSARGSTTYRSRSSSRPPASSRSLPGRSCERLEQRLPLLTGGRRDAPARQRTLRDAIAWSHDLLTFDERQLFARLAVFDGGWIVDAAEAVCAADLDELASLVDKSLLRFECERYSMLETIREYAAERLAESGEADELRRRHAEHFLALAESANLTQDAGGEQRHDLVLPEQANLRAALDWSEDADPLLGLRLTVALENFWASRPFEGARRLEALLERAGDATPELRARALRALGGSTSMSGRHDRAWSLYEESLALHRGLGDAHGVAMLVHRLGATALNADDPARARPFVEESLAISSEIGNRRIELQALGSLAEIELREGNPERARELALQSLASARATGFPWWTAGMLSLLAEVELSLGRLDEAESRGREALRGSHEIGDRYSVVYGLAVLAWIASARDPARAGELWGAVEAEEARGPIGAWEQQRAEMEAHVVREGETFEGGRARGRTLSLDAAVERALASDDASAGGRAAPAPADPAGS